MKSERLAKAIQAKRGAESAVDKKAKKERKFKKVMAEFASGKLKTSAGQSVKDIAQATAIAYSESGLK